MLCTAYELINLPCFFRCLRAHLPLLDFFLLVSSPHSLLPRLYQRSIFKNEIQAAASLFEEKTGVNGEDSEVGG